MRLTVPRIVAGGLAALALSAAIGGAAYAQTATPTPQSARVKPQRGEDFLNAVASKLGKTPAELRAAVVAAQKDRLAADVTAGRLTQAQADALGQRLEAAGGLPFGPGPAAAGPGHRAGLKGRPGDRGPAAVRPPGSDIATFLGIQPRELADALRSGKSLAQIAQEKGKSRDDLKAHLTQQERARLTAAVQAGRLTQAQADARLTAMTARLDQAIDRSPPTGPLGPRGRGPGPRAGDAAPKS